MEHDLNRSGLLIRLNICLAVTSTVFAISRAYSRLFVVRNWGIDDTIAMLAWIFMTVFASMEIVVATKGAGRLMRDLTFPQIQAFFKLFTVNGILYFIAIGLVRLSIVAFIPRLSQDRKVRLLCWALAGFITFVSIAAVTVNICQCNPIKASWDVALRPTAKCYSVTPLYYTTSSLGIILDGAILIIPLWIIRSRMIWGLQALKVASIFAVGSVSFVVAIVRLANVVRIDMAHEIPFHFSFVAVWTDIEGHVGLWAASFPAIHPLLRILAVKTGIRSKLSSTNRSKDLSSNAKGQSYGRRSVLASNLSDVKRGSMLRLSSQGGSTRPEDDDVSDELIMLDRDRSNEGAAITDEEKGIVTRGIVKTTIVESLSEADLGSHYRDATGTEWERPRAG